MRVSHSQKAVYQECRRLHYYQYKKKISLRKRPLYFILGEAVHKFIEAYYSKTPTDNVIAGVYAKVDKSFLNSEAIHDLEIDRAIAEGICSVYPKFYAEDFNTYQNFLTEKPGEIQIGSHTFHGILDCLMQDAAGDWWILETKTASMIDGSYIDKARIDSQINGYMHIAKSILNAFPKGVVYNIIKKPSIRLKKGETAQAFRNRIRAEYTQFAKAKGYFIREEIIIGHRQLERWHQETEVILNEMEANKEAKIHPMNTGACKKGFITCQFMEICATEKINKMLYEIGAERK